MSGLLDLLQAASNAIAGNVSGPVDLLNMGLHKVGLGSREPVGGSEWMEKKGLTRKVKQGPAQVVGETLGLLSPLAGSPQVAKGLLTAGENFAKSGHGPIMNQRGAIVYHGSPHKFDAFDLSAPKTTAGGLSRYGVSVSPERSVAERYARDFDGDSPQIYKIDEATKTPLRLSARDFNRLQDDVAAIDSGRGLSEVRSVWLEDTLAKYGVKWDGKSHPIEAINRSGFDSIWSGGSAAGAESEGLIFNPGLLKILERNGNPL